MPIVFEASLSATFVIVLCLLVGLIRWRMRWRRIVVFLSYRVASDAALVEELFHRLRELRVAVWWDKECLLPGQEWETGFANGLFGSRVFVPVLSKAALAGFANLEADSRCDNVLLEHVLALEQKRRGQLKAIFPVFVGETRADSSLMSDFFATGGLPTCNLEVPVATVDEQARAHLSRRLGPVPEPELLQVEDRTPGGVLKQICKFQGGFIKGARDEALDAVAHQILQTVHDVAAGRVIVEAADEVQVADASALRLTDKPTPLPPQPAVPWWHRLLSGLTFRRRGSPGEIKHVELVESEIEPHGAAATTGAGVDRFFSAIGQEQSDDTKVINPVMIHEAKAAREQEQRRRSTNMTGAGGKYRTGGLARLDDTRRVEVSDEKKVNQYLSRHQRVQANPPPRPSGAEADLLQARVETIRTAEAYTRRASERRLAHVARARCGTSVADTGDEDESERASAGLLPAVPSSERNTLRGSLASQQV